MSIALHFFSFLDFLIRAHLRISVLRLPGTKSWTLTKFRFLGFVGVAERQHLHLWSLLAHRENRAPAPV